MTRTTNRVWLQLGAVILLALLAANALYVVLKQPSPSPYAHSPKSGTDTPPKQDRRLWEMTIDGSRLQPRGLCIVTGTLTWNGDVRALKIIFTIDILDQNGAKLGDAIADSMSMRPGQTIRYEALTDANPLAATTGSATIAWDQTGYRTARLADITLPPFPLARE